MATPSDIQLHEGRDSSEDSDMEPSQPPLVVRVGVKVYEKITRPGVLFPQQVKALQEVGKWFESPETTNKAAVVSMPTGSGKIGVICCLPYKFGEAVAKGRLGDLSLDKPMLVIAPNLEILKQLQDNLEPRDNNTFIIKRKIIKKKDAISKHYLVKAIERGEAVAAQGLSFFDICLVNAQKGHKKPEPGYRPIYTRDDLPPDTFSVVVVDEAHLLSSKQWCSIIDRFKGHAKVVFFTATLYRSDKKKITTDIADAGVAYHLTKKEAIDTGIIRGTNPIDLEPHVPYNASKSLQVTKEMLPKIHRRLTEKNERQPLPGDNKHVAILIAPHIDDAEKIVQEWNEKFPSSIAECIHWKLSEDCQKRILQSLKDGKISLLVIIDYVHMLVEGFDHPPISIAAIATRIKSPVKFAQFIGKAQRVVHHNGEIEQEGITADVISDGFFQQGGNYKQFEEEKLIPI